MQGKHSNGGDIALAPHLIQFQSNSRIFFGAFLTNFPLLSSLYSLCPSAPASTISHASLLPYYRPFLERCCAWNLLRKQSQPETGGHGSGALNKVLCMVTETSTLSQALLSGAFQPKTGCQSVAVLLSQPGLACPGLRHSEESLGTKCFVWKQSQFPSHCIKLYPKVEKD